GVDDHVGALAERRELVALGPDAVHDAPASRQRMAARGLVVALKQRVLLGLEEDHLEVELAGIELLEHSQEILEVLAAADVRHHRRPLDAAALMAEELAERTDHARREVVDAEVAAVLERRDRLRLAGAR